MTPDQWLIMALAIGGIIVVIGVAWVWIQGDPTTKEQGDWDS